MAHRCGHRRTRDSAFVPRETKATPQIPHTLLFDLRRGEEGSAGSKEVPPQMEARNAQSAIRIPGKHGTQQQEEQCRRTGQHQIEEGFALQEQAPVNRLIPPGVNPVQESPQVKAFQWQPCQADVCELIVVIPRG